MERSRGPKERRGGHRQPYRKLTSKTVAPEKAGPMISLKEFHQQVAKEGYIFTPTNIEFHLSHLEKIVDDIINVMRKESAPSKLYLQRPATEARPVPVLSEESEELLEPELAPEPVFEVSEGEEYSDYPEADYEYEEE